MIISVIKEDLEKLIPKCPEINEIIKKSQVIIDGIYEYDIKEILECNEVFDIINTPKDELCKYITQHCINGTSGRVIEEMMDDLADNIYYYLGEYCINNNIITTSILFQIFGLGRFDIVNNIKISDSEFKKVNTDDNYTVFANEDIMCYFRYNILEKVVIVK